MAAFAPQYARALADVVFADKLDTEALDRQLADFLSTYEGSAELREVFSNPAVELDTKLKVLDAMAPRLGLAKQTRNFLAVLLKNGRMASIAAILTEYRNQVNLRLGIRQAEITSIRELTPDEKQKLEEKARSLAGSAIHPVYRQNPALLGGIVLRIGDTVYDGSVRGRLEELRDKLLAD